MFNQSNTFLNQLFNNQFRSFRHQLSRLQLSKLQLYRPKLFRPHKAQAELNTFLMKKPSENTKLLLPKNRSQEKESLLSMKQLKDQNSSPEIKS